MTIERLSDTAQSLYAELLDQCIHADAERWAAGVPAGSLVTKQIRGRTYWYLQRLEGERKRQHYLGPASPQMDRWAKRVRSLKTQQGSDTVRRGEIVRMLRAAGIVPPPAGVVTVLRSLSETGVFRMGSVLIGMRAFQTYGPMLGIRFPQQTTSTQDIDIAHDPVVELAVPAGSKPLDLPAELDNLELGFGAVPGLDPRRPSTSYKVRGRALRIDFLTPMVGAGRDEPVMLKSLGLAAKPVRFLDYLIKGSLESVIAARGGVLLRVPDPARFALHKLWVAERRRADEHVRARKDRLQAEQLLAVLADERSEDLVAAWKDLLSHSKAAVRVRSAIGKLDRTVSDRVATVVGR